MNNHQSLDKKNEYNNLFVIIETIISVVIVFATVLFKPELVSKAFTLSFIVLLIQFIDFVFKSQRFSDNLNLLIWIIIISFFNVMFSTVVSYVTLSFEYMQQYFIFVATLIFFYLASEYNIGKKTEVFFYLLQTVIAFAYIYCYRYIPMQTDHTVGLSFNFSNPNLAAMFILQTVLFMILGAIRYKNIIIKIFFVALAVIEISLMLKTGARNTLLALIIFFGLVLWSLIKEKYGFSNGLMIFFSYLPILFVPIYLVFINVIVEKGWFSFLISEGKNLTSRVKVWDTFFEKLNDMWLTGNYAYALGNAHNSHMVLLCSFGAIVLVLTIILLYRIQKNVNDNINGFYDACCLSAFFAILSMGIGEGAIFSGGQGIYILCGSFLLLVRKE